MCMNILLSYVYLHHMHAWCPWRSEEIIWSPRTSRLFRNYFLKILTAFVFVCMCVWCMYTYVCICVHLHMHLEVRRAVGCPPSLSSTLFLWGRVTPWTWSLRLSVCLGWQTASPRNNPVSTLTCSGQATGVFRTRTCYPDAGIWTPDLEPVQPALLPAEPLPQPSVVLADTGGNVSRGFLCFRDSCTFRDPSIRFRQAAPASG